MLIVSISRQCCLHITGTLVHTKAQRQKLYSLQGLAQQVSARQEVQFLSFISEDLSQNKTSKTELWHLIIFHVQSFEGKNINQEGLEHHGITYRNSALPSIALWAALMGTGRFR